MRHCLAELVFFVLVQHNWTNTRSEFPGQTEIVGVCGIESERWCG